MKNELKPVRCGCGGEAKCPKMEYCDDALKLMVMHIFGDYIYATHDIDLEKLREALDTLLVREQKILWMSYQESETLKDIGDEFGVTKERVRQIKARALRILRHPKFKIAQAKPAEPERKKGEWKDRAVYYLAKGEYQTAQCSVCGMYLTTPYLYYFDEFNFCPNCGADMRGEE